MSNSLVYDEIINGATSSRVHLNFNLFPRLVNAVMAHALELTNVAC